METQQPKYKSVIIDTITQLQDNLYIKHMAEKGKPGFDEWRNFGVELLDLFMYIKQLKMLPVLIVGPEGSGKSFGGKFLNENTNVWINCDDKPFTWFGANKQYPRDFSKRNYIEAGTYSEVRDALKNINERRADGILLCFIIGHVEYFKQNIENRERLRVIGKMANKHNLEGSVVHCYYSMVDPNIKDESNRYFYTVHNSGFNTARSPQGYFDDVEKIPNNMRIIAEKICEDFGETYH